MKSDGYSSHSLVTDKSEQVVQNLQYNITTSTTDLPCDTNITINATFSIDFFDIGPYEEVLVSCGLTVQGSFKLDNTMAVLTQCEFYKLSIHTLFCLSYNTDFLFQINQVFQASKFNVRFQVTKIRIYVLILLYP